MITLDHSFIYSYFIYCYRIWGNICKSSLSKLHVRQNKAVWIVTDSNPRSNTELLYRNNGFLNLYGINSCLIGKFKFNVYHIKVTHISYRFITQNRGIRDYNKRIASHCHVLRCSKNLSQTGIRFQRAIIWNKILKAGRNPDRFEASLKQRSKKCVLQTIINWVKAVLSRKQDSHSSMKSITIITLSVHRGHHVGSYSKSALHIFMANRHLLRALPFHTCVYDPWGTGDHVDNVIVSAMVTDLIQIWTKSKDHRKPWTVPESYRLSKKTVLWNSYRRYSDPP